jgi:hypothetical protein
MATSVIKDLGRQGRSLTLDLENDILIFIKGTHDLMSQQE